MTWTEMQSDPERVKTVLEDILSRKYQSSIHGVTREFTRPSGESFRLHVMGSASPWSFIVIEYGSGEDGDGYYPEDYESADKMAEDMILEIEAS